MTDPTNALAARWQKLVHLVLEELKSGGMDGAIVLRPDFPLRKLSFPGTLEQGQWTIELADDDLGSGDLQAMAEGIVRKYRESRQ